MSYVVVEKEDHSVDVAGPNPARGNTGGLGIYNGEIRVSSLEGRTTALESSTKSVAERVAAGEMNGMAGLDNGGTPPLPGVVLSAQIAAAIAAGWPENRIFWVSLGTESGVGSGNLGALALSATSALFLGTLVGHSSGNLGTLGLAGLSTLSLGTLAGVVISAGSASLGSLSLTGTSALSLGTLAGVQIGNTGNLSLTGTSTLALGSLAGVTGSVNGDMGNLSLTGTSTLALGTLAGEPLIYSTAFNDLTGWSAPATGLSGALPTISSGRALFTDGSANNGIRSFTATGSLTVEWVSKFDSVAGGYDIRIYLETPASTAFNNNAYLALVGNGVYRAAKYVGGAATNFDATLTSPDTVDHTYKMVVDTAAGTVKLYDNGVLKTTLTGGAHTSFDRIVIFSGAGNNSMDSLKIY